MARKRSGRRRRLSGFGFLYKLLMTLSICAVVVIALTLFFKVDTISVDGQQRYTRQQIQDASGVKEGDNLFLLNKHAVAQRLMEQLPYLEEVRINRALPSTLLIQVTECGTTLALTQDHATWLISPRGKIVDRLDGDGAGTYTRLDGCALLSPSVGTAKIAFAQEYALKRDSLLALAAALEEAQLFDGATAIHLEDASALTMDYIGRFAVEMPYGGDYPRLLQYLQVIVDKLESNVTGTIDMTREGEQRFRPD